MTACGCEGRRLWWTGTNPVGRCLSCAIAHNPDCDFKINLKKVVDFFEGDVDMADRFLRMIERSDEVSHEAGA